MKPIVAERHRLSIRLGLVLLFGAAPNGLPAAETAAAAATPQSHFAQLGTNKIHYLTAGHGKETILFVHGWACNADFWREQFSAFAPHARLIALDLPGHGQSDKPIRPYTMDFFAEAVLAVLDDAHIDQAVLVGHSMGTPVICLVYARAPKKVAALVAVDGLLRRPTMAPAQAEKYTAPFRTPEYLNRTTQFVRALFPNTNTASLSEQVLAAMVKTPQQVMSSAMDAMFDSRQPTWDLTKVEVPLLVLNAASPRWTAEYQDYVHSLSSQTDYRTIAGVGHFLMLEKPAEFNAALSEMLRKFHLIAD